MRASKNHIPTVFWATVAGAFVFIAAACAPRAAPTDVERELAELRREHEMMRAELETLRRHLAASENAEPRFPAAEDTGAPVADSPTRTLTLILEDYRRSLEDGDLERLRSAVYGGHVPSDDARLLATIVDRTQGLKLELETRKLDVRGHRARLVVDHTMDFRLRLTQEPRRARLALVMLFEEGPDGWYLAGIRHD